MPRFTPSIEPQFHIYEIDTGVGRATRVDLMVFTMGWGATNFFIFSLMLLGP